MYFICISYPIRLVSYFHFYSFFFRYSRSSALSTIFIFVIGIFSICFFLYLHVYIDLSFFGYRLLFNLRYYANVLHIVIYTFYLFACYLPSSRYIRWSGSLINGVCSHLNTSLIMLSDIYFPPYFCTPVLFNTGFSTMSYLLVFYIYLFLILLLSLFLYYVLSLPVNLSCCFLFCRFSYFMFIISHLSEYGGQFIYFNYN